MTAAPPPRVAPVALGWDAGRDVPRFGKRVYSAPVPPAGKDAFWAIFHAHKELLKAEGYTVWKNPQGVFELNFWTLSESDALPLRTLAELKALILGEAAEASARLAGVELPELLPWIVRALRGYQVEHTQRLLRSQTAHRASVDTSQMGLGKTYCAVAIAAQMQLVPYVVCPLAVVPTWNAVFKHFGVKGEVMGYEALRTTKGKKWLTTTKNGRGRLYQWKLPANALIVGDEIHRAKNPNTITTQILLAAQRQRYRIHVCSGTIAEDPGDMRFLGALCKFHDGTQAAFGRWAATYRTYPNQWGALDFRGDASDLARLHSRIYPEFGSRLRVQDLPPGSMPPNVIVLDPLQVDSATAEAIDSAYHEAEREAEKIRRGDGSASFKAASVLAEMMKARVRAEKLKLPWLLEAARERMREGYAVLIGLTFRLHMLEAAEALGDPRNLVIGAQPPAERAAVLDNYQQDRTQWLVLGTEAGGVGISAHTTLPNGRPRWTFPPLTWSAASFLQWLGRAPRNGGTPCHQQIVMAAGTIEEDVRNALRSKVDNINTLTDADLAAGLDLSA